jgi:hypothetical protein
MSVRIAPGPKYSTALHLSAVNWATIQPPLRPNPFFFLPLPPAIPRPEPAIALLRFGANPFFQLAGFAQNPAVNLGQSNKFSYDPSS